MNHNLTDELFGNMRPLLDIHISSEQVFAKFLAYLNLLEIVYVSILEFDISKHMIKFWSMNISVYAISDSLVCFPMPIGAKFELEVDQFYNYLKTLLMINIYY